MIRACTSARELPAFSVIGGPAVALAENSIKKVELVEYPELGMEAIWRIEVEDFPAFTVVDHQGKDFYAELASKKRTFRLGRR